MEKIEEIIPSGEQVVVFSHFLDMLNLIKLSVRRWKAHASGHVKS
jgi:hypothetical protein